MASARSAVADPQVTLTVTVNGAGSGWVTSTPAGISCSTVCSAQFPLNTYVQLAAQSATGSMFDAPFLTLSGSVCGTTTHGGLGADICQTFLDSDTAVQATFDTKPPPCIVPGVRGKTLFNAERFVENHNCGIGTITRAFSGRMKKGRVISQNPKAHWHLEGGSVDLVVSKGKR